MIDTEIKTNNEVTTNTENIGNIEKVFMKIDESVNINATVNVENNRISTSVMYLNCSLNADTLGLNINVSVSNKDLYKAHATEMKAKYKEFKDLVNKRAESLGYIIF